MRQLRIQVPNGRGPDAMATVARHGALNSAQLQAHDADGAVDLIFADVPNAAVGPLINELQTIAGLRVTFMPAGVIALAPPAEEAPRQVIDIQPRSPIEVYMAGLQSVGSWKGFLGYAAAAGAVVWIGLFTNTIFLLTAAMLISPFAGPAMNAAIATARGDAVLLGRSVLRYFVALIVTMIVAAILTAVIGMSVPTELMAAASDLSTAAVLLPVVAGAAGALNLSQSERSSLVTGAATGMLVAASLAPPAGLIGMAGILGRWDMVKSAAFVLLLQIIGINLSGASVFRLFNLRSEGQRFPSGRHGVAVASAIVTSALLAIMLAWQFSDRPDLQRSTRAQRTVAIVNDVIAQSGSAYLVEANMRFTRSRVPGQNTLLGVIYVQRAAHEVRSDGEIAADLGQRIRDRILETERDVTPLLDVTVLAPR